MSRWAYILCAGLVLAGCPKEDQLKDDPNVIARVNGEVISRAEFERELSRELQALDNTSARTPEQAEPFKKVLVQTVLERTLLLQEAKSLNVSVSTEEVDRQVLRMSADFPAEGFNETLAQSQMSLAELKRKTAEQLTIEKLFQLHVYPRVAATEEEIRLYFEKHADQFSEPERVRAAQIFVQGLDEAKKVQQQLRAGKKFSEMARRYSLSPEAKVGGDLGLFPRGVMPPAFDEVLFKMGVGQTSDIVSTDYGFHLFQLNERLPAKQRELNEVRSRVEERLLTQKRRQAQEEYVALLRSKADIRVNEEALVTATGKLPAVQGNPEP